MNVVNKKYLIQRIKPDNQGYKETVIYTGSLRSKPKGWRVLKQVQ